MAKVSVIIPIYNKESRLRQCLQSVVQQTYADFEAVLVDDGSTDGSGFVAAEMAESDARLRYYRIPNSGVSAARNFGIEKARGRYVTFLDADDFLDSKFLSAMVKTIADADVAYCGHFVTVGARHKKARFEFTEDDFLLHYLANRCTPNTNSWIISKQLIESNKISFREDLNWGEDMLFFCTVALYASSIRACREYLTFYEMEQAESLSSKSISKIEKDLLWIEETRREIAASNIPAEKKRAAIELLRSYRLPAAIAYRLFSERDRLSPSMFMCHYLRHKDKLVIPALINGLRSVKLLLILFRVKMIYWNRWFLKVEGS